MAGKIHNMFAICLLHISLVSFFAEGVMALDMLYDAHVARQEFSLPGSLLTTGSTPTRPTSTSSSPSPTFTPILFFDDVSDMTACQSGSFSWIYSGPKVNTMSLIITNNGVSQGPPPLGSESSPGQLTKRAAVNTTVSTNVDPTSLNFAWSKVSVAQGWYIAVASIPTYGEISSSDEFFVRVGQDTSCLTVASPSSTKPAPPSTSSATATRSPSPSNTPAPVSLTSESGSDHKPVIIGVVLGVFALILIVAVVLWFRRRKASFARTGAENGESEVPRSYGGLSSGESGHKRKPSKGSQRLSSNERAAIQKLQAGQAAAPVPVDPKSPFATSEEKVGGYSPSRSPINPFEDNVTYSGVPTLNYASSTTGPGMPEPALYTSGIRRPSMDSMTYPPSQPPAYPTSPITLASTPTSQQPHVPYYPAAVTRSASTATSRTHHTSTSSTQLQSLALQPTSSENGHAYNKRSSLGAGRKTARKPVPVYDPEVDESATGTPISPASPADVIYSEPMSVSISQGHYSTKAQSEHNLVHKSSFGPGGIEGKPLHYLIPDMPMPMKG